ncbi:MAG: zinc metalloprotease [Sphingomonadales bacterium 32-68-7]|nr:MAG: zinc metalloprotease [Sphingomonadales bacterium 12-68-11]OYX09506.1 MAG: zinc metalloprotease [Sphingomonadales bacterium 32-68-7]
MIRSLLAGASALTLAFTAPAMAQPAAEPRLPEIVTGAWGVDLTQIDPAIDPGDDFFGYVNNRWIAANPIPPQFTSMGNFTILRDETRGKVRALVEDMAAANPAPGTHERRVVDAYRAFLDTAAIDRAGIAPARPHLERIAAASDLGALMAVAVQPGFPRLFGPGVTIDPKNPNSHAVTVGFAGMGLPGREYYLDASERNLAIQADYKRYLAFLLGKAGHADAAATAEQVYAFEHKVAEIEWAPVALRNRDLTYNLVSAAELAALAPGFPTAQAMQAAGVGSAESVLVSQLPPSAEEAAALGLSADFIAENVGGGLPAMMRLIAETPLPVLKAYMTAQFLSSNAAVLGSDLDRARFTLFDKTIYGREEQEPRWKRSIAAVEGQIGELLGASYVARHFPPSSKAQMDELVANLVTAMREDLTESTWLSEATKREAQAKLATFEPRIGYGESFKTYDGLAISAADPLANALAAAKWRYEDALARLGKPVDRKEWPYVPQTVNASYRPNYNQIVFPAGILQPPFFNASADPAVNYGAIGAVIGHEIGHGFDDQGSKYDGTGALRNWWQDSDRAAFDREANKLVKQFDGYCPLDEGKTCVNGRLTLGENIGDLVGLEMAYRAYRNSLGGKEAPVIDGLTGDQRFFLAFAQVWRGTDREGALRDQMLTDPHSPENFRANGTVRNMDAWYAAFNVTSDDALYLPPEDRARIW